MSAIGAFYRLQILRRRVYQRLATLEEIQAARLRALVRHAYANVPYYHDLMQQAGLRPGDIRNASDLRHLPVTDRTTLRQLPDEMTMAANTDARRCEARRTSGSESGTPWAVLVDSHEAMERALITIRSNIENGYRLWHRQAFVQRPPFRADTWFKRLGILRSVYVSLFDDIGSQMERLQRLQPARLVGQPSALLRLVDYGKAHNIFNLRPALISTMGERLRPEQRQALSQHFGGVVYDRYGTTEGGILGWECERHEGYHLNLDQVIVECVQENEPVLPGTDGDVALTNLASYVRPLIRVTVGDVATMAERPCPCGRSFPLLARVLGRRDEFFFSSGGRWLAPQEIESTLDTAPGLGQYQLLQETPTCVHVQVVTAAPATLAEVRQRLCGLFGPGVEVVVASRDSLPLLPSGKVRRVISRVGVGG